jgi:hypothetical protein
VDIDDESELTLGLSLSAGLAPLAPASISLVLSFVGSIAMRKEF